jgi:peptidoglycan/xylan/chitin deacetylase (PgdA/CDA1 family)
MSTSTRAVAHMAARTLGALLSPAGQRGRLAVFCYHQVLERKDSLRPGEPDAREFAIDLEVINRLFTVLPLVEAARRLSEGSLPARAACVTFDDGYANNHDIAAPALEAAGVPATFFIATGAVEDGIMWNDLVLEAVARRGASLVLPEIPGKANDAWPVDGDRTRFAAALLERLKYRPLDERTEIAARIFRTNVDDEPPRLMMTRGMVASLASRGFGIGGHSVRHPILAELPDAQARIEIEDCARWIEELTGQKPREFAYPNGRPERDFALPHEEMVREAGYTVAVSTEWNIARQGGSVYRIPRIGPWWRQGRSLPAGSLRLYGKSLLRAR